MQHQVTSLRASIRAYSMEEGVAKLLMNGVVYSDNLPIPAPETDLASSFDRGDASQRIHSQDPGTAKLETAELVGIPG